QGHQQEGWSGTVGQIGLGDKAQMIDLTGYFGGGEPAREIRVHRARQPGTQSRHSGVHRSPSGSSRGMTKRSSRSMWALIRASKPAKSATSAETSLDGSGSP